ncbi:MAG: ABC transporter permease [Oscillospiraceae bacterium]|nr:ABC transporter permease [Oscillospiraceae bacterium]
MKLTEQLRSVFLSIMANKFRVILTSLGIIIGSFTIIMVVGIGRAGEASVTAEYKRLSVETINITEAQRNGGGQAFRISDNGGGGSRQRSVTRLLTESDVMEMPNELDHVKAVGISTTTSSPVVYGTTSQSSPVIGVNQDYFGITNLYLECGDYFTDDDGTARNKVTVLGNDLAHTLFDGTYDDLSEAIGDTVKIKGLSFTVVGILQRVGGSGGISSGRDTSVDSDALIPYDVAIKYTSGGVSGGGGFMVRNVGSGQTAYIALANDIKSVQPAIDEINAYIAEICGNASVYNVSDVGSTLSSALKTSNTMAMLLMAVAAIVLIVSGIGIMNVLMVAVSERTREIGILKSLGAKRRTILSMFLFEAFFISIIGGALGVCLSVTAPIVLKYFGIDYLASSGGILLGLGFSVVTGIFFGYYPAWKASKLKPIDALNKE